MPKPQGTYRRIKRQDQINDNAKKAKKVTSVSRQQQNQEFYLSLESISLSELDDWHRSIASYIDEIKKNSAIAKEDRVRAKASEIIGEMKDALSKVKEYRKLSAEMRVSVKQVIKMPDPLASPTFGIDQLIAIFGVLQWMILWKRKDSATD
jgi:hypothetical protein